MVAERKRRIQGSNLYRQCLGSLASYCANHYANPPQWVIEDSNLCSPEGRGFYRPLQLPLCQSPMNADSGTRTHRNMTLDHARLANCAISAMQCSRSELNQHWIIFETIASAIGLREHASDGIRTRTSTGLSGMPLPLGYTGANASGGSRTLTNTLLRRMPLPLGYASKMGMARVELATSRLSAEYSKPMSYTPMTPRRGIEPRTSTLTEWRSTSELPGIIALVGVEPTPSPYKEDALNHMSFRATAPDGRFERPTSDPNSEMLPLHQSGKESAWQDLNLRCACAQSRWGTRLPNTQKRKRQESNPLGRKPSLFSRQLPTVRRHFQSQYSISHKEVSP